MGDDSISTIRGTFATREAARAENSDLNAALRGSIAVSAVVSRSQTARAEQVFREAGAADVETG